MSEGHEGRQFFSESEKVCLQELVIKYNLNSMATIAAGNPAAKKMAWARLTNEFNSIESNTKRTAKQLKKCWDNLKTRRKQDLAREKRSRMSTGGGSYRPENSQTPTLDGALLESTDVELRFSIDSDATHVEDTQTENNTEVESVEPETLVHGVSQRERSIEIHSTPVQTTPWPLHSGESVGSVAGNQTNLHREELATAQAIDMSRRSYPHLPDFDATSPTSGARNVRAHVIKQEFNLRQLNYVRTQEREEELHCLKKAEAEWLLKAAQENYKKACIEREAAEELLRCNRAKREAVERGLLELN